MFIWWQEQLEFEEGKLVVLTKVFTFCRKCLLPTYLIQAVKVKIYMMAMSRSWPQPMILVIFGDMRRIFHCVGAKLNANPKNKNARWERVTSKMKWLYIEYVLSFGRWRTMGCGDALKAFINVQHFQNIHLLLCLLFFACFFFLLDVQCHCRCRAEQTHNDDGSNVAISKYNS